MLSGTGSCSSPCTSRSLPRCGLHQNLFLSGLWSRDKRSVRNDARLHKTSRRTDHNRTKRAPSKCYFSCRPTPASGGSDDFDRQDVESIQKVCWVATGCCPGSTFVYSSLLYLQEQRGLQRLLNIVNQSESAFVDLTQQFAANPENARVSWVKTCFVFLVTWLWTARFVYHIALYMVSCLHLQFHFAV